jgi:hypothetical protein
LLRGISTWSVTWAGWTFVGFHVLFGLSVILRVISIGLAVRVHEPSARGTRHVALQLIGATPFRILYFPVGLYRGRSEPDSETEADPARETLPDIEAA